MTRHVILVEDKAHVRRGHYSVVGAKLANGLCDLGCSVELLTREGWAGYDASDPPPFQVSIVGASARSLFSLSDRLNRRGYSGRKQRGVARRATLEAASIARSLALALGIRGARRRSPPHTDVISYAFSASPIYAAALDGPGRILHHTMDAPASAGPPRSLVGRGVAAAARNGERRRRRRGGGMRLAAGGETLLEQWKSRAPYLHPVFVRNTPTPEESRDPNARATLGIRSDAKVALVFGTLHPGKDLDVVWEAFAMLPDWTLLVVGTVASAHEEWYERHGSPAAVSLGGFVEDSVRVAAYSAADVVILSFRRGHLSESGVLQEAVAFRVPVVCTAESNPAEDVIRFGLGVVCAPGDPAALADAVRRAPAGIAPEDLAAVQAATSVAAVARAHLDALDEIGRE